VVLVGGGLAFALRSQAGGPSASPAGGTGAPSGVSAAAPQGGGAPRLSGRELANVGLRSTVALHCDDSVGSGFFVAPDTVLTNAHVVCGQGAITARVADGREVTGMTLRTDERLDLALVRLPGFAGVPLPLGDAGGLHVGDRVIVVGSPAGLEFSVSQGSVASVDRPWLGLAYLQTDTAINPGNSGGPMLDETGHVVGVVSMKKMDAEGIGLALPINYAYTGAGALLPAPGDASEGFGQRAARAEELDQKDAQKLAATGQRPGIMGVELAGGMIRLQIVWPRASDPGPQTFTLGLMHKEERVCTLQAPVTQWKKVEQEDGGSVLPGQMKSWLDRHGFSSDFYVTAVFVNFDHCSADALNHQGLMLEMEGADPAASRVRFQ
jgi:S1-C subfamily serine protease